MADEYRKKRKHNLKAGLNIGIFFLVILFFIGLSGITWGVLSIPSQAAAEFGPADERLSPVKKFNLAVKLLLHRKDILQPLNPSGSEVPFSVNAGEPPQEIANRLEDQNLIPSSEAFLLYLIYTGKDKTIQAGEYRLSPAMNLVEIAGDMQDATPAQVPFTILPGWRIEEVAASLPTSGLDISPGEFLALASQPESFQFPEGWNRGETLEGFLFPQSYMVSRKITGLELLQVFLNGFQNQLAQDLIEGFTSQGLDVFQAVTLASIVQREAIAKEEQPEIASVFLNRLNAGMSLDSDPTVQYALGYHTEKNTWWKSPLAAEDLGILSGYNTYANPGLPPGPICSPSISALMAVAHPVQTPYYYFRARCDGSGTHNFAVNYQEHLNNACP